MSRCSEALAAVFFVAAASAAAGPFPGVGRTATPAEIRAWDIDVRPDFKGLPPGSGSVTQGQALWDGKCASCHGTFAESNETFTPLVGGTTADDIRTGHVRALAQPDVARTTLMKVATLSTLWDYINRAMPWNAPKSLATNDVYAVLAYLLNLGDIVPADFELSDRNIAQVQQRMPNRNGMTRDHGLWDVHGKPDVKNVACMKDCPTEGRVASTLPEYAREAHGDLARQQRDLGRVAPGAAGPSAAKLAPAAPALARNSGCFTCHGVHKHVVGPAFAEVAQRYSGKKAVDALVSKVRKGGSGNWGSVPMPPHGDLDEGDARTLVEWVLAGAPGE